MTMSGYVHVVLYYLAFMTLGASMGTYAYKVHSEGDPYRFSVYQSNQNLDRNKKYLCK